MTGGYVGCGKALSNILYSKNGTVYIAGRSKEKADAAMSEIKNVHPSSDGRIEFLHLDLADLTTIKASTDTFLSREQRLDVLTNNAGISKYTDKQNGNLNHVPTTCSLTCIELIRLLHPFFVQDIY